MRGEKVPGRRSVIIGVDAAWKWTNDSGVAVVSGTDGYWRLDCVAASYSDFFRSSEAAAPASASELPKELIRVASELGEGAVKVVAIDMPLSGRPIEGRRCADNTVNSHYAARWASTHSMVDAGAIQMSADLTAAFEKAGFPLVTQNVITPALIEVYPHIALIELMRAPRRLEYKVGKQRDYWVDLSPPERKAKLLDVWRSILAALGYRISDVDRHLQVPSSSAKLKEFKSFEDKLDAVVCAYVAIEYLGGGAKAYGNQDAAIWGPKPMGVNP